MATVFSDGWKTFLVNHDLPPYFNIYVTLTRLIGVILVASVLHICGTMVSPQRCYSLPSGTRY